GRAAAEHLAGGGELNVALETDDRLVAALGFLLGRAVDSSGHSGGRRSPKPAARSYWCAMRSTPASSSGLPTICKPTGRSCASPAGTLTPGRPARLVGMVNRSFRYIARGSCVFAPSVKATPGLVGVTTASWFSKTVSKSALISVRA